MKKVLMLAALFLGTTAMVNAQEPAKTAPAKEVKEVKVVKHHKKTKGDKKAGMTKTETKTETKTVAKK